MLGIALTSAMVFALLLVWTAIDDRYGGTASDAEGDGACPSGHRCLFCSCGRTRSMAESADGGRRQ